MARLLLSCDQRIKCFQGRYYTSDVWLEFFQRYLRVFEKLRLAVRCESVEQLDTSWKHIDSDRIEIVHVPDFSGPKQYLRVYHAVGKAISKITDGCDAAIIRLPSTIGQRVGRKVVKSGIPYAVEIVYDARDGASNSSSLVERMLWKRIDHEMRDIAAKADGVSCVTEHYLQQHYFSKKPDAFVSNYSTLSLEKNFFAAPRKFPEKEFLSIVHVANQVDCKTRKGHIQLIKILSLLKERNIILYLTFVGPDYHNGINLLREMAEKSGVASQITFTGGVDRKRLSDILDSHDLFVFPTSAEGLPRVVIEAMAKGLPCVISDVSGNPELVSGDMLAGYMDMERFAEKVKMLTENKDIYESQSRLNFEKSRSYESSMLQKKRDDFYKRLKDRINK